MNKMNKLTLLTAIAMIAFTVNSYGQTTGSTGTGTSTVTVITPLEIAQTKTLDFGQIAAYDTNGTYTVAADATGASATNVKEFAAGSAATFNVTGETGKAFTVTLPTSATLAGAGVTMEVTNFTQVKGAEATGTTPVTVGATLNVNGNQAAGVYTGEYQLIVQYN